MILTLKYLSVLKMNVELTKKGFKIVFWNIRSILSKIDSIRILLQNMDLSIVAITESWLKTDIPSALIEIEGYTLHRLDRSFVNQKGFTKRGGGIIIYVKNNIPFDIIMGEVFNASNSDSEIATICVKRPHTRPLYLVTVYRPPDGNIKNCISTLNNLLKLLPRVDKSDVFVGGDFNIDYKKTRQENTKKLKHFALENNLMQLITESTRPLQSDAIIDLIFSNCQNIQYSGTLPWNLSDHVPVITNIKKQKEKREKAEFKGRSYRRFDQNHFLDLLNNKNWDIFYNSHNVDTKWDILYKNVLETLDDQIPVKTFIFPKSKPEWLVDELAEYMKDRDSLLKRARRTKNKKDKILANKARNKTNRLVKNAKNCFVKEKLNNFRNNPKKFWEQIKSIYPTEKNNNPIKLSDPDGKLLDRSETAELINSYFTNIGPDLAKATKDSNFNGDVLTDITQEIQPNPELPTLHLQYPPREELNKWINNIKNFKSSGLPLVASRIWKIVFHNNPNLLSDIINLSIDTGVFPNQWKKATVIPIPKVAKPNGPEDLRPISLLPLPGKIFEHLLHSQIDNHLETNNLITKTQNGFRAKHSTTETVFDFLSGLFEYYNKKQDTVAIYIDFKKAFDTVNHSILLKKLRLFNFGENVCTLLKSYLAQRCQITFVNGESSNSREISYGVPQGSVLGPKLFLMFINDLVTEIKYCKFYLYADDIVMYKNFENENSKRDIDLFRKDIKSVEKWCVINELTVNIKKTKLQYFPHNRTSDCDKFENETVLTMYNQQLSYVNSFKYLGIEIDRNLNMKGFYEALYKLVNHKLYLLKLIRPSLTIDAAVSVSKSMILSLIDYGNIFLTGLTQEDKSDLQKLQNRILRCSLNIVDPLDMNVTAMHELINVDLIGKRRTSRLLTTIHNGVNKNKFTMLNHDIRTRHNDGLKIELLRPRNELVRKSGLYLGTLHWNNLPLDIREMDTISFKKEIKIRINRGDIPLL